MARNRKIQKYGNADIIRLKPNDLEDMGLTYGDMVDVDKIRKQKTNLMRDDLTKMIYGNDAQVNNGEKVDKS